MYQFHGWIVLAETSTEADTGGLRSQVQDFSALVERLNSPRSMAHLRALNGTFMLSFHGSSNRLRDEGIVIDELLLRVADELPGSWGLVYDRDDESSADFRVRTVRRGRVELGPDPFFSPARPKIED